MRNFSDRRCRENQNDIYVQNIFFLIRAIYEMMWKNIVVPDRLQITIQRMRITCWIP